MSTDILHVSDTHLGKQQYGSEVREDDFARAFDTVIDIAIEEKVDSVIHTGDLFDNRNPSSKALSDAFRIIKKLDNENIPFLGIVGNHERKWDNQWIDILGTLDNVHRLSDKPFIINDSVAVYGFDSVRDVAWESKKFQVEIPNENLDTILCLHELFVELVPPIKADRELETILKRTNLEPDAVALGDYHANVSETVMGVPVFYAGATERTSATQGDPTFRMLRFDEDGLKEMPWRKIEGVNEGVPRPFYPVEVSLSDDSIIEEVRERIMDDIPNDIIEKSVVVLNIVGSTECSITPKDCYNVLDNLNVKVPYVNDKRQSEALQFDSMDISDPTTIDIETMISEEVEDVSKLVRVIDDEIVRDLTVNKSEIRSLVETEFKERGEENEN